MPFVTLDALKVDLGITDSRDDAALRTYLDAAVAFVKRVRDDLSYDGIGPNPPAGDEVKLGTLRLAGRWYARRKSPDGLVAMGELGSSRVPTYDVDIDRPLRLGKFRKSVVA